MGDESLEKHICGVIANEIEVIELSDLTGDESFASMGIDSIGMIQIISALEEEHRFVLSDKELEWVTNIRELTQVIERRLSITSAS